MSFTIRRVVIPPARLQPIDSHSVGLIVQDYVKESAVHSEPMAVVVDEAKPLELVHELTDP